MSNLLPQNIFSAEVLLQAKIEATPGTPEVLTSVPYIPATEVRETVEQPVTKSPILGTPGQRQAVIYQTDDISGATVKTFLFAADSIGKQVASSANIAFFIADAGTFTLAAGETIIIGGVTATHSAGGTPTYAAFFAAYKNYVENGTTPGAGFAFTGTLTSGYSVFVGHYDSTTDKDWMMFVADDPLAVTTPPSKTGTGVWSAVRTASSGSATQTNLPIIYPYAVAAGLNPTASITLGLSDSIDTALKNAVQFHNDVNALRPNILSELNGSLTLLSKIRSLLKTSTWQNSVDSIVTKVTKIKSWATQAFYASQAVQSEAAYGRSQFAQQIALGDYYEAVLQTQLSAGRITREGFIRFNSSLGTGKSFTFLGATFTASRLSYNYHIVDAILNGTTTHLTITAGSLSADYTLSARRASNEIEVVHTSGAASFDPALVVTNAGTGFSTTIAPPFGLAFDLISLIDSAKADIIALSTTDSSVSTTFDSLKDSLISSITRARTLHTSQKSLHTTAEATGGVFYVLDAYAIDTSVSPADLTYTYTRFTFQDTGITALQRITVGSKSYTELGDTASQVVTSNSIVTSFDLMCVANQPPELSLTIAGNYEATNIVTGDTVSFEASEIAALPSLTAANTTLLSLVPQTSAYEDGNIALQEFNLANFAGLTAARVTTADSNFHRVTTDRVNRVLNLTLLDGNTSDASTPIVWREQIGQAYKFKLAVGSSVGFRYNLEVFGIISKASPVDIQTSMRGQAVEITVTSATLILS